MSISVIISVFNEELNIQNCLNSILNQSYQNFEILIVDDKSTDSTLEKLYAYVKKDKRIKLFKNSKRKGLASNLNFLINKSKNDYIARADADDFYHLDRLKLQKNFLDRNIHIDVLGTDAFLIDNKKNHIGYICKSKFNNDINKQIFFQNPLVHSSVMMRKNMIQIKTNKFYDTFFKRVQDYDLWLRIFDNSNIYSLNQNLTYYTRNNSLKFKLIFQDIFYGNICRLKNINHPIKLVKSLIIFNTQKIKTIVMIVFNKISIKSI